MSANLGEGYNLGSINIQAEELELFMKTVGEMKEFEIDNISSYQNDYQNRARIFTRYGVDEENKYNFLLFYPHSWNLFTLGIPAYNPEKFLEWKKAHYGKMDSSEQTKRLFDVASSNRGIVVYVHEPSQNALSAYGVSMGPGCRSDATEVIEPNTLSILAENLRRSVKNYRSDYLTTRELFNLIPFSHEIGLTTSGWLQTKVARPLPRDAGRNVTDWPYTIPRDLKGDSSSVSRKATKFVEDFCSELFPRLAGNLPEMA